MTMRKLLYSYIRFERLVCTFLYMVKDREVITITLFFVSLFFGFLATCLRHGKKMNYTNMGIMFSAFVFLTCHYGDQLFKSL